MNTTTIRLPEELREELKTEAQDRDESFAEYVRWLLLRRDILVNDRQPNAEMYSQSNALPTAQPTAMWTAIENLTARVHELEERLDRQDAGPSATETPSQQSTPSESVENAERDAPVEREETSQQSAKKPEPSLEENETETGIDAVLIGWRPGRDREKREQQRAAGRAV